MKTVREHDTRPGLIALSGTQGLRWNKDNTEATLPGGLLVADEIDGPRTNVPEYPDARTSYWTSGGCGAFAAAMVDRWPHLKIAVDIYMSSGEELVSHCWAYDGTHKYDIFGSEEWEPTEHAFGYDSLRVVLDQSAEQVDALFSTDANLDAMWEALDVIEVMFGEQSVTAGDGSCVTMIELAERWPEYGSADGARGESKIAALAVQELVGGELVRCTNEATELSDTPDADVHYAVLLNGSMIDLAARELNADASFPSLTDGCDYAEKWESTEKFDPRTDEWSMY